MTITARLYHEPVAGATTITLLSEPSTDSKSKLEKLAYLCGKIEGSEAPSQPGNFSGFQENTLVKAKELLQESLHNGSHRKVERKELKTLDMLLSGILRRRRRQDQSNYEKPLSIARMLQLNWENFWRMSPGSQSLVIFAIVGGVVIVSGKIYTNSLDQNLKRPNQLEEIEALNGNVPDGHSSGTWSKKYSGNNWQKGRRKRWAARKDYSVASFIRRLVIICITIATFSVPIWHTLVLWEFMEM
jgi:hypothetical protein